MNENTVRVTQITKSTTHDIYSFKIYDLFFPGERVCPHAKHVLHMSLDSALMILPKVCTLYSPKFK